MTNETVADPNWKEICEGVIHREKEGAMSETNETIADIVAEMRTKAKHLEECSSLMVSESALALFLYPLIDRIEAAWKQEELRWAKANGELAKMLTFEKAQGGNAAAMRTEGAE